MQKAYPAFTTTGHSIVTVLTFIFNFLKQKTIRPDIDIILGEKIIHLHDVLSVRHVNPVLDDNLVRLALIYQAYVSSNIDFILIKKSLEIISINLKILLSCLINIILGVLFCNPPVRSRVDSSPVPESLTLAQIVVISGNLLSKLFPSSVIRHRPLPLHLLSPDPSPGAPQPGCGLVSVLHVQSNPVPAVGSLMTH